MNLSEIRSRRNQILELAEKHGVKNIRVFGSVARGEADWDSDVDFLVEVVDLKRFAWGGGGLLTDLENLLGCKVDLVTEGGLHWYIRERILKEAVPV